MYFGLDVVSHLASPSFVVISSWLFFNPLYSCKNGVNCMNKLWTVGSKAGTEPPAGGEITQVNPALEVPKFGVLKTPNLLVILKRRKIMNFSG